MMIECVLEIAPVLFYLTPDIWVVESVEAKGWKTIYQHYGDYCENESIRVVTFDTNNAPEISLPFGANQEVAQSRMMDFTLPDHPMARSCYAVGASINAVERSTIDSI